MHWVYILKCEDNYYYVGETTRLYRRFWEHSSGCGGLNTSLHPPIGVVAIYKVNTMNQFLEYNYYTTMAVADSSYTYNKWPLIKFNDDDVDYDHLDVENSITEWLIMKNPTSWNKIRGGKYTRFNSCYAYPDNNLLKDLPLCHCGLPCDVRKNTTTNRLFYRCAKKNMWDGFKEQFDVEDPCNFYLEYTKDIPLIEAEKKRFNERKSRAKELFKTSQDWLKYVPEFDDIDETCVGGCRKMTYSCITWNNRNIKLCFDCFIDKNEHLTKTYSNKINNSICLI